MLDKIKEALGEELSKQVEEAIKKADIELAVFNDGSVVPAEKYEPLKVEHDELKAKYQSEIAEMTKKIDEAVKGTQDYETLKGTLDTLKSEQIEKETNYQKEINDVKILSEYKVKLIKENADPDFVDLLIKDADFSQAKIDGESILGIDTILNSQKEKYKKAFGEIKRTGEPPEGGIPNTSTKSQLIEKYNEAEKAGNAKLMFALDNQIRNTKE